MSDQQRPLPPIYGAVFRGDTLHLFQTAEAMQAAVEGSEWSWAQKYEKVVVHVDPPDEPEVAPAKPRKFDLGARVIANPESFEMLGADGAGVGVGVVLIPADKHSKQTLIRWARGDEYWENVDDLLPALVEPEPSQAPPRKFNVGDHVSLDRLSIDPDKRSTLRPDLGEGVVMDPNPWTKPHEVRVDWSSHITTELADALVLVPKPSPKFKVGDRVVKDPETWRITEYDLVGSGVGVGEVVESPYDDLDSDEVEVRWPAGRMIEREDQLMLASDARDIHLSHVRQAHVNESTVLVTPELPAGKTPAVPGAYLMDSDSPIGIALAWVVNPRDWEHCSNRRFAGPVPLPSFIRKDHLG